MAKRINPAVSKEKINRRNLFVFSLLALIVKLIIVYSNHNAAWMGSDGESYQKAAAGLMSHGLYSKEPLLSFWPAGYPIILWVLASVSSSRSLVVVTIFQSIVYFGATAYFAEILRRSQMKKLAWPTALIYALNPTLSLSSMVIGYESLVASCMIVSIALVLRYQLNPDLKILPKYVLSVGVIQAISAFMQPRGLVIGFAIFAVWGIFSSSRKTFLLVASLGTIVMLMLPLGLVLRNYQASGNAVLSTNLGFTMSIGAGDNASGGYASTHAVLCTPRSPETKSSDKQLVYCVLDWYLHHPAKTVILAIRKSIYFWSPWYGPLANGTMARNPWLYIDPVRSFVKNKPGYELVFGWFGQVVSWIWLIGGLFFLIFGFGWLWQQGELERQVALLAGIVILLAWLTALGTIGDHRFRLPTMGLSLFLQLAGYFGLKERLALALGWAALEPRGRTR